MRKENVFVVAGRLCDANGEPCGGVVNRIVCAVNDDSMRKFAEHAFQDFLIVSVVNLSALESLVSKVKSVLAAGDTSWPVFVEPGL